MARFDVIILGAGQSGMPLAKKISNKGLKVALVEERAVGGEILNRKGVLFYFTRF